MITLRPMKSMSTKWISYVFLCVGLATTSSTTADCSQPGETCLSNNECCALQDGFRYCRFDDPGLPDGTCVDCLKHMDSCAGGDTPCCPGLLCSDNWGKDDPYCH